MMDFMSDNMLAVTILLVILNIVIVAVVIRALLDWRKRPSGGIADILWALCIVYLFPPVGAVLYLLLGKRGRPRSSHSP